MVAPGPVNPACERHVGPGPHLMMADRFSRYDQLQRRLFLTVKTLVQAAGANPRRHPPAIVVFVSGVHRSGTNMTMRILERSIDTDVFHESDPRAFDNYMMRKDDVLCDLIARSSSRRIVFKALHEAHDLRRLMTRFEPSRLLWVYRHFDHVVDSIARRWPGSRNLMDQIITRGDAGGWRGLGMSAPTRELLAGLYHDDMNDVTITALFWYQRNQLLLDQGLESDRRCMLVNYETLARAPVANIKEICNFLDISHNNSMRRIVHARSIAKNPAPPIEPRVRALCQELYDRLREAARGGTAAA